MADYDAQPPPGLLGNPFAVLGATTRTTVDELFELADTPERSALARVLSVPRSRLAAEVSFLPGAADQAPAVLAALRAGQRPDPANLPPLAAANLRAHLCAAGLATEDDFLALATAMPGGPDPGLLGTLDADRDTAGMPHVSPAALAEALDGLTDAHASTLADGCGRGADGAARLSRLVEAAPPGRPPSLLRRTAAAWVRRTATELAALEEAANGAVAAWSHHPDPGLLAALDRTVRDWAALSRPQRLVDARAALDHPATLRALSRWRQSLSGASGTLPGGAAPVRLLAELFGDLPGEGPDLRREARNAASAGEEAVLAPHLLRLRDLVTRLAADVLPLRAQMAARPFGPGSRKAAGELWTAFEAAVNASTASEAPWTEVLRLAPLLDAPPQPGRDRGVYSFYAGLVSRAEAAGRAELAARLRGTVRERRADAAVAEYDRRKTGGWRVIPVLLLPLVLPWQALRLHRSARRALHLLDNLAVRGRIEAEMAERRRRARPLQVIAALAVLAILGGLGAQALDTEYALHAPFRTRPAISLASRPAPPAPAPFTPPPVPAPTPAPLAAPRLTTFPDHPGEVVPGTASHTLTRAEVRWCLANIARWRAARDIAMPEDEPTVDALGSELQKRCANASVHRADEDTVGAEIGRNRDRLRDQGEAMLGTASR